MLLAAALAHWFFVAGWCGFYDGGPVEGQRWACDGAPILWSVAFAAVAVALCVWAGRPRSSKALLIRALVAVVTAAVLWRLVPFELAPGAAL
jgi:hypothetical protein